MKIDDKRRAQAVRYYLDISRVIEDDVPLDLVAANSARLVGKCPQCSGTLRVNVERGVYHCLEDCGTTGTALDWIAQRDGITVTEAARRELTSILKGFPGMLATVENNAPRALSVTGRLYHRDVTLLLRLLGLMDGVAFSSEAAEVLGRGEQA